MKALSSLPPVFLVMLIQLTAAEHAAGQPVTQSPDLALPAIFTVGDAVVRRPPDRAFVDATVETRAKTPRDAQAQNAQIMANVQQKLRAASLAKDAVRTIGYGVQPEFDFVNGRRQIRDYLARNAIEVRVDDLERVGEIVDLVVGSGATSVGDVRFDLKDHQAAEREALGLAVADAKAKAEAIAAAAGRPILTISRIVEEAASGPGPRPMMERMAVAGGANMPPTPINAGDIEVRARVTLTALMK